METLEKKRRFTWLHLFSLHLAVTALFVQFLPEIPEPQSVKGLVRLGATLELDDRGYPIGVYFPCCQIAPGQLAILAEYPSLKIVDLWRCTAATDDGLASLRELENLEVLILGDTEITDAGLQHLAKLKNLKQLSLSGTAVTDAGLTYLQHLPRLESIVLEDTAVTDAGMARLAACKQLKLVCLLRTDVSEECIRQLRAALPGTTIFT